MAHPGITLALQLGIQFKLHEIGTEMFIDEVV
jgi:hypothetical protein